MAPRETTVAASVVADMVHYLAERGIPAAETLGATLIDPGFATSPDQRVPGASVERLWKFALARTADPVVGLHMAEAYNPGTLDILGYVILSCATIGDVLERLSRYARLLNDGMRVELVVEGESAYCRSTFVEGLDNYLLRAPEQAMAATWGGLARELRRLATVPLAGSAVWFRHPEPAAAARAEYERVIGAPLRFDAPDDRFVVPVRHLAQPIRSANPMLLQVFDQHADAALARLRDDVRVTQVARLLTQKLKGSAPGLDEIARELAMSSRNLQRSLRDAGTTYQALLDDVRRDLAIRHLANPTTSASQVGFLLGFSEPSAFHRAFRRWTGKAPSAYRATLAQ
jgi:AraC-like DNA-binding protein